MDVTICLPALYPLRYVVDHLEYRSPSTQSASLQAIKFFYDFWFIKHRTTFCYSFYFSGHDPAIAIHEMTDFFQYLENGRLVSFAPRALPFKHSSCMTNASRVRAVIRFIGYLIATYVSPYYRNETPKELSRYASRLNTRLLICKDEFKTLERSNQRYYSRVTQGFQSMTGDMVENVYRIVVPSSKHKNNFLNPFPSGFIQFRNYLIMRLMLNYGLRVGELLLPECVSVKIPGIIFLKSCSDFDDKHIHNEGDGFFITQEITALSLMVTTRMY
ncbi:integrase [Escherichia coli]|nr:integrase [Escherichia coli]EFH3203905.1 integrase [Escherichia coli]EFJ5480311.1 integrase [Escherichia coli]EFK2702263.1 integrase [Escherichia coli]EFK3144360.1 integrase [Escherichia coli]